MNKIVLRLSTCLAALVFSGVANAAMQGSNPEYPLGNTLGIPTGMLPPPGLYLTFKPSYTQGKSVNGEGHYTGGHSSVWGATGSIGYIPGIKILGAQYGFFIRSLGYLNVALTKPAAAGGKTYTRIGLVDTEFTPISLSWNLGHRVFVNGEFSFYIPNGQYSSTATVNVGQNHWTIEPDMSVSYLPGPYQFTAHLTIDKNFENQNKSYTNGTTMDWDFTALRSFGKFSFGPVGYFYKQITPDEGPVALNGGSPEAIAAGVDAAYHAKGYLLNMYWVHDVYDRNVTDNSKILISFVVPIA